MIVEDLSNTNARGWEILVEKWVRFFVTEDRQTDRQTDRIGYSRKLDIIHICAKLYEILPKKWWRSSNGQIQCFCNSAGRLRGKMKTILYRFYQRWFIYHRSLSICLSVTKVIIFKYLQNCQKISKFTKDF